MEVIVKIVINQVIKIYLILKAKEINNIRHIINAEEKVKKLYLISEQKENEEKKENDEQAKDSSAKMSDSNSIKGNKEIKEIKEIKR